MTKNIAAFGSNGIPNYEYRVRLATGINQLLLLEVYFVQRPTVKVTESNAADVKIVESDIDDNIENIQTDNVT